MTATDPYSWAAGVFDKSDVPWIGADQGRLNLFGIPHYYLHERGVCWLLQYSFFLGDKISQRKESECKPGSPGRKGSISSPGQSSATIPAFPNHHPWEEALMLVQIPPGDGSWSLDGGMVMEVSALGAGSLSSGIILSQTGSYSSFYGTWYPCVGTLR